MRSPKFMQEGLQNFPKMNVLAEKLRPLTLTKENQALLEDTRKAAEAYRQSMQGFLENWLAMQDLAQKRADVGDKLLAAAKEISVAGIDHSQQIATNATVLLHSASNIMGIGLINPAVSPSARQSRAPVKSRQHVQPLKRRRSRAFCRERAMVRLSWRRLPPGRAGSVWPQCLRAGWGRRN